MPELASLSSLAARGGDGAARMEAHGVCVEELRDLAVLSLRAWRHDGEAAALAARVLGLVAPQSPNRTVADERLRVAWLEPNAWLAMTQRGRAEALLGAHTDARIRVSDLSAKWCVLSVAGANARRLIAAGCPLDLDESVFRPGECATSLYNTIPIHLQQISDAPAYWLACDRSLALALWDDLAGAAHYLAPEFDAR